MKNSLVLQPFREICTREETIPGDVVRYQFGLSGPRAGQK